jgi:hypothetical protein
MKKFIINIELNSRKAALLFIFITGLAITSCIDDIELNLDPEQYSRLIVDGRVTDIDTVQTVILRKSMPYDRNEPNPPATGAMVTISVDDADHILEEVEPGIYQSPFTGITGKTYTLNILYADEEYTATSTMLEGFEIDSIGFKKFPFGMPADMPHYEILVYGQDSPVPDQFYLFKHSIDGAWVDTVYYWSIHLDVFWNGEYLQGESVAIVESPADSLEVQVMSMSVCEDYVWFVDAVIWNFMPNMFFSPPKANVRGNVNNGALGFFHATSVSYSEKRMIHRKDFFK